MTPRMAQHALLLPAPTPTAGVPCGHVAQHPWAPTVQPCRVLPCDSARLSTRCSLLSPRPPQVFHAGTSRNTAGEVVSAGGRVLNVTALGKDVAEAQARAYEVSG